MHLLAGPGDDWKKLDIHVVNMLKAQFSWTIVIINFVFKILVRQQSTAVPAHFFCFSLGCW